MNIVIFNRTNKGITLLAHAVGAVKTFEMVSVATKKDFETKNRKKFCGRIATGDYDAIIIGHSQFEKIPMSIERQRAILEQQLDEVTEGIAELKKNRGDNFSVKQLERG